jgi:hypothetical protein
MIEWLAIVFMQMPGSLPRRPGFKRGAVEMLGSGSGMERILSSFEAGWLIGLSATGCEDDCPFVGADAHLSTFWLDGFHSGREDARAAGDTPASRDTLFMTNPAPNIGLAA